MSYSRQDHSLLPAECQSAMPWPARCSPALLTAEQLQGGCCARPRQQQQQAGPSSAQLRAAAPCRRGQNQSQLTGGGQAWAVLLVTSATQTSHLTPGCRLAATLSCTLATVHCVHNSVTTMDCAQCNMHKHKHICTTMDTLLSNTLH